MNYSDLINEYIQNEIETLKKIDTECVSDAVTALVEALNAERTIYIFGNGGSAATASHFQGDFNKGISEYTKQKYRFVCLNDNVPTVMAIANDIGYEEIFREQLKGRVHPGDVVIAISGSGDSANILNAVYYAKSQNALIIGLTGYDGGELKKISDISLHVNINSMQITEDVHMMLDHLMMSVLYKTLCGKEYLKK